MRLMRTLETASWWKRLLAIVYDTLIVAGLLMVLGFVVLAINGGKAVPPHTLWYQLLLLALLWAYFALSWWRAGQTVGARAWKLEVRDLAGNYPSLARASLRAVLAPLSIGLAGIGLLWCLFDPENQSAHDRLSRTQLLQERKS
jgi:uncharacterized RDD family membrane protein YckC